MVSFQMTDPKIGAVIAFPYATLPDGVLPLDGTTYDEDDYPDLYAALDAVYKDTIGHTLSLPDLRGRGIIGAGEGAGLSERVIGDTGGEETHQLTPEELAAHNHANEFVAPNLGGGFAGIVYGSYNISPSESVIESAGEDAPHNNMQPFHVMTYGIVAEPNLTLDIPVFTGATSSTDGSAGLVPAPDAGEEQSVLRANGTWSDAVQIADDGNVGIGKSDPAYPLDVNGDVHLNDGVLMTNATSSSNIDHVWHDDTDNTWHFVSDQTRKANGNARLYGANVYMAGSASNYFNGRVGIGTTSPGQELDVNGDIRISGGSSVVDHTSNAVNYASVSPVASTGKWIEVYIAGVKHYLLAYK